ACGSGGAQLPEDGYRRQAEQAFLPALHCVPSRLMSDRAMSTQCLGESLTRRVEADNGLGGSIVAGRRVRGCCIPLPLPLPARGGGSGERLVAIPPPLAGRGEGDQERPSSSLLHKAPGGQAASAIVITRRG